MKNFNFSVLCLSGSAGLLAFGGDRFLRFRLDWLFGCMGCPVF